MKHSSKNKNIESINKKLVKKPFILLGEIHGASINSNVIYWIIKKFNILDLFIELEGRLKKRIINSNKNPNELYSKFKKDSWIFESGVIDEKKIKLFRKLNKNGIRINLSRIEIKDWNTSEKATASKILKQKKINRGLIIFGALHSRKRIFYSKSEKNRKFIPLGFLLRNYSISIRIRYADGEIYNFGTKKISDRKAQKIVKSEKKRPVIIKSQSKYFDYDLIVSKTNKF